MTETSPRQDRDNTKTTPRHHQKKTETGHDRDMTESMNFSILKHHPSTYGPQLHWFAQRCTIYKFKLELWIWLRNPIKMFINVHHQKIKTPSPKQKATSTTQHPAIITHHQNIAAPSPHITETSPIHARDVTNTSLKDPQNKRTNKTTPKQHRDITKKRQRQDRDTTET